MAKIQSKKELSKLCQETLSNAMSSIEKWRDLLDFMARHYKQSYANQIALYAQCPNAEAFAEYSYWDKLHMPVKRGEHAYCVFSNHARGFYRGIFDVSQTSGERAAYERLRWDYDPARDADALGKAFAGLTTEPAMMFTHIYDLVSQQTALPPTMQNAIARSTFYCLCNRLHVDFDNRQLVPEWNSYTIENKRIIAQETSQMTRLMLSQIERSARYERKQQQNQQVGNHRTNIAGLVQQPAEASARMVRQASAGAYQPNDTDTLLQGAAGRHTADDARTRLADSGAEHEGVSSERASDSPGQRGTIYTGQSAVLTTDNDSAPLQQLITSVTPYLEQHKSFTQMELFRLADEAYGGTQAEGKYTVKDATDALELAVNQWLNELVQDWNGSVLDALTHLRELEQLVSSLPTQTRRTKEMEEYQQFSTPPQLAYLTAWLANITPKDIVLEPSAGVGGLAVFAKAWGAQTIVNEFSQRRAALLKHIGFDSVFQENAEQLDNILPDSIKPTIIIMNPPFSAAAERLHNNRTAYCTQHIEQALLRLQDGGRLVALLGNGMADGVPSQAAWWDKIKAQYNVRANIGIDGENYRKYGTTFDIRLVVIDKTGATVLPVYAENFKDLAEIPQKLEGIRYERQTGNQRNEQHAAISQGAGAGRMDTVKHNRIDPNSSIRNTSAVSDAGRSGDTTRLDRRADRNSVQSADTQLDRPGDLLRDNKRRSGTGIRTRGHDDFAEQQRIELGGADDNIAGIRSVRAAGQWIHVEPIHADTTVTADGGEESVYSEYTARKLHVAGAVAHPAQLVESAAMAAVMPPDVTYQPHLPEKIAVQGILSEAQLETIIYAGQAHSTHLADGMRRGYFIGDGTGVGKGRQICGIILDNKNQGREKAVWISQNKSLLDDARRDWIDLGGTKNEILDLGKIGYRDITEKSGVLFCTYDTLRAKSKAGKEHIPQIKKWLGTDFDGVIVFDEAHNMANATDSQGTRGVKKASLKALAGIDLQDTFPEARVVYASATGATDIKDFAYLTRMGLWGKDTAFTSSREFINQISAGGLAAMELVARDMKAMGVYAARSISYAGVEYDTLQHSLTPMQREIYDTASQAWQLIMQKTDDALRATDAYKNSRARANARGQLFGSMQRFYNQVLTSMSMPSVIADIRKELQAGHSCVLQIVNTNESETERSIEKALSNKEDLDAVNLTPADTLCAYLQHAFPVQQYELYIDDHGNERSREVKDSNGNPVLNRQMVAQRDALIAHISEMKLPDGALEQLIETFGTQEIAEITGRKRRIVTQPDENGQPHRVIEKRGARHNAADVQAFQDGKKHILIFSDAGGTGKSYHADRRAGNQQKRIHYLLQPGWNASKATQGFGRTHRSNQVCAPTFRLVTTDVMGQKRFISTIARRLDQLGALTKGQRQTGSGMFGEKDNLESDIARDTLAGLYRDLLANDIPEIDGAAMLKRIGLTEKLLDHKGVLRADTSARRDINLFLNRILCLNIDEQNAVFGAFYQRFTAAFDEAVNEGNVDMGMENYRAEKIETLDTQTIWTDERTGAQTSYLKLNALRKPNLIMLSHALTLLGNFQGLYRLKNGTVRAVYRLSDHTLEDGTVTARYRLQAPALSIHSTYIQKTLDLAATPIPKEEWDSAWRVETERQPEFEQQTLHLLTGSLLPIWNRLPQNNTRVMRILTADGNQLLGRLIADDQIQAVLQQFHVNLPVHNLTPKAIKHTVMQENKRMILAEHLCIERHRVSGEYRMELIGQNLWWYAKQYPDLIQEEISYHKRYFIPISAQGEEILASIMKEHPIQNILAEKESPEELYQNLIAEDCTETDTELEP